MTLRSEAQRWLAARRVPSGHLVTSKYYAPEESWTKEKAWWIQIPWSAVRAGKLIHIVCEAEPGSRDFRHLQVPAAFFLEHERDLATLALRQNQSVPGRGSRDGVSGSAWSRPRFICPVRNRRQVAPFRSARSASSSGSCARSFSRPVARLERTSASRSNTLKLNAVADMATLARKTAA